MAGKAPCEPAHPSREHALCPAVTTGSRQPLALVFPGSLATTLPAACRKAPCERSQVTTPSLPPNSAGEGRQAKGTADPAVWLPAPSLPSRPSPQKVQLLRVDRSSQTVCDPEK